MVKVKITERIQTQAFPFYYHQEIEKIVLSFQFSLKSDVTLVQRSDLPYKYELRYQSYDLYGNIFKIRYLRFDKVEWIKMEKITDYFFILSINIDFSRHATLAFQIKMNKDSLLPRTKQFYSEYGMEYFIEPKRIKDAAYTWINDQVIWSYKLMEGEVDHKTMVTKPQRIVIERLFIPAVTKTTIGYISL